MVQNAADVGALKKKAKQEESVDAQEKTDLQFILNTPQGRRYIWRHMVRAGIFESCFTGNSATFFNEGKREVGLKMLAEVTDASPDAYLTMMKDAKKSDNQENDQEIS